jgi:hypothetical protein
VYDQSFFESYIQRYPREPHTKIENASHRLIVRVREYFDTTLSIVLSKMTEAEKRDWLVRLWVVISSCLVLVVVEAENEEDATEVFEVLNERGVGLSSIDLLRNFLLGSASTDQERNLIVDHWGDVFSVSDNPTRVQNFLRHFWIARHGDVKARGLYREIKAKLRPISRSTTTIPLNFR